MQRLKISPHEAKLIHDAHQPFVRSNTYDEVNLSAMRKAAFSSMPERLGQAIHALRYRKSLRGALLVQGLISDQLEIPPTPTQISTEMQDKLSLLSEGVALGVALVLGEPVAYRAEKSGALVQQVFPIQAEQKAPSNESSASMLNLHTELVFSRRHPKRPLDVDSPDFVLLLCLRSDPKCEAATLVAEIGDLCAEIPSSDLSILRQPRFELRAPYSFTLDDPDDRPWVGPVSLLGESSTLPTAAFDLACGARALDDEAGQALKTMKAVAMSPGLISRLWLEAGDLLILDNRRCAHGRTPFLAAYDGKDRWIQRIYVRISIENMEPFDGNQSPRVF